jgi:hypothetical protein
MNPLYPFSIGIRGTFQKVEGEVGLAWGVVRMHMQLRNYDIKGANRGRLDGGWKFGKAFE